MVYIYSEHITERLRYVCGHIFGSVLGVGYELGSDAPQDDGVVVINYSDKEDVRSSVRVVPCGLLEESGVRKVVPDVFYSQGVLAFFRTGGDFEFDVFSATFYMISRYEEYNVTNLDKHGRFMEQDSLMCRNGVVEMPVVDLWLLRLKGLLAERLPSMTFAERKFTYLKTIDVDNVFAFRHKGVLLNGAKLALDLAKGRKEAFRLRLKSVLRQRQDPYFNLEEVAQMHDNHKDTTLFFFHSGGYGKFDKKVIVPSLSYRRVRANIAKDFKVGLHPSHRSAFKEWLFSLEKKVLENVIGESVVRCRFHYLRCRFPESYKMLERIGVKEDYSLGFSNTPGFRAGTSYPFFFYDLTEERQTDLKIFPLVVMDKTLRSNLNLNTDDAFERIKRLAEEVKRVNGVFVTLFHNENLTDEEYFGWKGWKDMYKKVLLQITSDN